MKIYKIQPYNCNQKGEIWQMMVAEYQCGIQSNYDDSWWLYLVLSSWASLTSAMAGAFSTSITVDHVYGLVALLFQALKTKAKHFMALSPVASAKHS